MKTKKCIVCGKEFYDESPTSRRKTCCDACRKELTRRTAKKYRDGQQTQLVLEKCVFDSTGKQTVKRIKKIEPKLPPRDLSHKRLCHDLVSYLRERSVYDFEHLNILLGDGGKIKINGAAEQLFPDAHYVLDNVANWYKTLTPDYEALIKRITIIMADGSYSEIWKHRIYVNEN